MRTKRKKAAFQPVALRYGNISKVDNTKWQTKQSSENLKEQLGLLLFHLHSNLRQNQSRIGWQLFEILLVQYLGIKGGL